MERNVIPRKFEEIIIENQVEYVYAQVGDKIKVTKENGVLIGENLETCEKFPVFLKFLRNPHFYKIIEIKK